MQTKQSLETYPILSENELKEAYERTIYFVTNNIKEFTTAFPDSNSEHNFYKKSDNVEWTTGFWTGEIWLAYEASKQEELKKAGLIQVESFLHRMEHKIDINHHDMGFLYSPSCVAAYKLTGNETAKKAALLAADNLISRFQEKGQFFQAWGDLGTKNNYRLIIDCLLNMPLLFWASEVTKDDNYANKAIAHIKTAMNCVIRPDHSTYHTYFFNPITGEPEKGVTHQGNRDGSAWARGQAWGIYGCALSYKRLKNPQYIVIFKKLTDYFLTHLPSDLIPYWDFDFTDRSDEPRDSSSLAIAICGMLEMANYLSETEEKYYRNIAKRLLKGLIDKCAVKEERQSNGLLLHGTYARASVNNPCTNRGVDECNTWGDYYYFEALTRLVKNWDCYW